MEETIVFTGGGTGGHVFPGLAVIEALRDRFTGRIVWIGSRSGIEREILTDAGVEYRAIPSGKFRRYFDLRNFLDIFRVLSGLFSSLLILSRLKPKVVFSKGGYVSVPPVIACRLLGIPCITHESDIDPGLATKINSYFVDEVLVAYPEAGATIGGRARIEVTGNPVRRAVYQGNPADGRRILGVDDAPKILFFLGGSLGSRQINTLVDGMLARLLEHFVVVHQCGRAHDIIPRPGYFPFPFIREEYGHLLAASDLVVCRAGANTLWELSALGKPAVLIPLSAGTSRGDQIRNAAAFAAVGAGIVLDSPTLDPDTLYGTIVSIVGEPARLQAMGDASIQLGGRGAADMIVRRILTRIASKAD